MNIEIEQKKEYLKPQMTVLEFEHEKVLCASGCDDCEECEKNDGEVPFVLEE